jgi:hypothetical protein
LVLLTQATMAFKHQWVPPWFDYPSQS